jgi:hypothetical protein
VVPSFSEFYANFGKPAAAADADHHRHLELCDVQSLADLLRPLVASSAW